MNKLKFPVLVLLSNFFIIEKAYTVSGEPYPKFPALALLSSDYQGQKDSFISVNNMPPCRSQDSFPGCYGFMSSTLYDHYRCKQERVSCEPIDPEKSFSPLYLTSIGVNDQYKKRVGTGIPYQAVDGKSLGGSAYASLYNLSSGGYLESCYPFDQFVQKHSAVRAEVGRAFERLRVNYYEKYRTEGKICEDCLIKDLSADFDLKLSSTEVLKALKENTFDRFLFDILLKDCAKIATPIRYRLHKWPEDESPKPDYQDMLSKMKELLKAATPVGVNLCLDEKVDFALCKKKHGLVVSGYRKYCKPDGTCRESLKVQNSWGKDWQEQNNDGWIDAKNLYDYLDKSEGAFTWISDK